MKLKSCLYRGYVAHRRQEPAHGFRYSTSWIYLDLDEVEKITKQSWCMSEKRFSPLSFRRSDHFGEQHTSLKQSVHRHLQDECDIYLTGPVRLLTQLRHFGVYFSPINVFYCFDENEQLVAQIAEVSNTPWNERHCYVLWEGNRHPDAPGTYTHAKEFHVSPFMDMDTHYDWQIQPPNAELKLSLSCRKNGRTIFNANLELQRRELTDLQLIRTMLRRPVAAVHIVGAIYFQALRLWMKKCRFYPHPRRTQNSPLVATLPEPLPPHESRFDHR